MNIGSTSLPRLLVRRSPIIATLLSFRNRETDPFVWPVVQTIEPPRFLYGPSVGASEVSASHRWALCRDRRLLSVSASHYPATPCRRALVHCQLRLGRRSLHGRVPCRPLQPLSSIANLYL